MRYDVGKRGAIGRAPGRNLIAYISGPVIVEYLVFIDEYRVIVEIVAHL